LDRSFFSLSYEGEKKVEKITEKKIEMTEKEQKKTEKKIRKLK